MSCYSLWFIVTIYDLLLLFMARLFGPRRRLIQAIEQITGKASSSAAATAAAAVTVNKQTITSGPANNDIDKISDSEQEHVRLLVCLSLICIILFLNHSLSAPNHTSQHFPLSLTNVSVAQLMCL